MDSAPQDFIYKIKLDFSVFQFVNDRILDRDKNKYWDDDFIVVDYGLFQLSEERFLRLLNADDCPPIQLEMDDNGHYFYADGRHRHSLILLKWLNEGLWCPKFSVKRVDWSPEVKEEDQAKLWLFNKYHNTGYIFIDFKKRKVDFLHVNDFARRDYPVIRSGQYLFKHNGTKRDALFKIKQLKDLDYLPESLLDRAQDVKETFSSFFSGLGTIFDVIVGIGSCRNSINSKVDAIRKIADGSSDVLFGLIKQYSLKFLKLLASSYSFLNMKDFDWVCLSSVILDFLSFFEGTYQRESLDSILLAGISMSLPNSIIDMVKRMSLLTNRKLFDDTGVLFEFLSCLGSCFAGIISLCPPSVKEFLTTILSSFGINEFVCMHKAKILINRYKRDKRIVISIGFRNEVKQLDKDCKVQDIKRFFQKNKGLSDVFLDFQRILKSVTSYENAARVEPNCFIFEGPPGCRKSVTVNSLISILGLPHYAHSTKCVEDGKEWFDMYDNEDIFYMDDVGQMGKGQWRNLINWVSAVKLPLECAEASLKDTKYFNSNTILITTNNFMHLQGFTAKDCIETPEALWRRGLVFDMSQVTSDGPRTQGRVVFRHFDLQGHSFVEGFPLDFERFLNEEGVVLETSCSVEDYEQFMVWSSSIILGFKKMKESQKIANTFDDEYINRVRLNNPFMENYFDAEHRIVRFDDIEESMDDMEEEEKSLFAHYLDYCLTVSKDLLQSLLSILWSKPKEAMAGLALTTLIAAVLYRSKKFNREGGLVSVNSNAISTKAEDNFEQFDFNELHTLNQKLTKSVFEANIHYSEKGLEKINTCHVIVSERNVILPYHAIINKDIQITIFRDRVKNHIIIDHGLVTLVYANLENDVAIVQLNRGFPTPFPKIAHCFVNRGDKVVGLVFPGKVVKLDGIMVENTEPIVYPLSEKLQNSIGKNVTYKDLHYPGMCGVPVVTLTGSLLGMHIVGSNTKKLGVSLLWSERCLAEIREVLMRIDIGLKISSRVSDKIEDNCSGIKITTDLSSTTPKNSNFVPSPLYNLFETTRKPANLSVYGPHTVKDIGKSARTPIHFIDPEALSFAKDAIKMYFKDFGDLTEQQIVNGDEILAGMNKKSSNGIFPLKTKEECFDYEKGTFKPEFRRMYDEFENKIKTGDIEPRDIAWCETLKDELRNAEKKEPRSFRVSPVTVQVLTKKCFGNLVKHLYQERWFNEIMIGINPVKDWKKIYSSLVKDKLFAGDIHLYDKSMLAQVQQIVVDAIMEFYKGDNPEAARNILNNLVHSIVVLNDDVWVLTHSLPSGSWLTAIFNSLVNRVYTLLWYYLNLKKKNIEPNKFNFHKDVIDYVYGDDRVNCCKNEKLVDVLNAITMAEFFESIGMKMTDSGKKPIEAPFQSLDEITFLKRSFRFHPEIMEITCPLDLRTIYSSLSWVDGSKDDPAQVVQDKISAFQREIFLHYDKFDNDVKKLVDYCDHNGIMCKELPRHYLLQLYVSGDYLDIGKFELLK